MSCLGRKFGMTESTRTLKGSGLTPSKTVTASPTRPGRTSDRGKMAGAGWDDGDCGHAERGSMAETATTPSHHAAKRKWGLVTAEAG